MSAEYISATPAGRGPGSDRAIGPGPATPLALAGICLFTLALIWIVAALVPATHLRDAIVLHDFTLLSRPHVDAAASGLLAVLEPAPFIALAALLVAVAFARRRWRLALAVAFVLSMAPLSAELLKPLLAHPHQHVTGVYMASASWPSGHATVAAALVLCSVLVSPARLRPLVAALGGLFALAVGCALLILAWHMPSDVLGGYLLAALWFALAVAGLRAWARLTRRRREGPQPAGL
jgi:membrane-associated phospholipid phosphatase